MSDERQPTTNDYRKRIARPVFVRTCAARYWEAADNAANAYAELVSNSGGEVIDVRPMIECDTSGDYPTTYHLRVVTYRAASPIAAPHPVYTGDDE